jgi:hypothetical protein
MKLNLAGIAKRPVCDGGGLISAVLVENLARFAIHDPRLEETK